MSPNKLNYDGDFAPKTTHKLRNSGSARASDREASAYVYFDPKVTLAVNVAIATGRPILVRGESGSGKSTLARNAADVLGWRYYERVITSNTKARDLLWEVDLLRRLNDARGDGTPLSEDFTPYLKPGPLWWAFDRVSAARRGGSGKAALKDPNRGNDADCAVVLLDEIDKADPDVPNNLLVPLGSMWFEVEETSSTVSVSREEAPLVFITTNGERDLPPAFLRRCVELELHLPNRKQLIDIGRAHFKELDRNELARIADALVPSAPNSREPLGISPAEFLDTVRAASELGIDVDDPEWEQLTEITLWKHGRNAPTK